MSCQTTLDRFGISHRNTAVETKVPNYVKKVSVKVKAVVRLKAFFSPLNLGLIRISRSRFKQSKNSPLISQINVLQ